MKGVNHHSMNENNKYLILRTISMLSPCSRTQLCEYTKLSKMTITNIVNEYIRQGIVQEYGKLEASAGRRAGLLRIAPDSLLALGIRINRNYTEIGVINLSGSILRSGRFEIYPDDTVDDFLDTLIYICSYFMEEWKGRIWGIGISAMGPLEIEKGIIFDPPGINLKNIPVCDALYRAFNLPAFLELDSHVAALSELYHGNFRRYENFLYIMIDNWIGGCLILDRKVCQGVTGLAGLIGGIVIDRDSVDPAVPLSGCLQEYASILALTKWAREKGPDPAISWNRIVIRARRGEPFFCQLIDRLIRFLETVLVSAIALLDVPCIYLTGPVLLGADLILEKLEASLNRLIFAPSTRRVEVLAARYSENAAFIGITALVTERHFERKTNFERSTFSA
ncbi:MAG: ROK family protein [Treponema sp.]|nr:ROK family protein [Treponema sp.]